VPGLRGLSNRIGVGSILWRFLEHSRIFYFENGGKPEYFSEAPIGYPAIFTSGWKYYFR
jgi:polyphosphate kinase